MEVRTQFSTVPAAPGWYIATLIEGGSHNGKTWDACLSLDPIIAWEIERHSRPYHHSAGRPGELCITHSVSPITTDGAPGNLSNMWAIKRPDGQFDVPDDCWLGNEADVIKHLVAQVEAKRAEAVAGATSRPSRHELR